MEFKSFKTNLHLFDNTNITGDTGLAGEMKTYYSDYLIDLAEPELVHDQFGMKHPIPKNGGKIIEFRKYDSLPKALTPLEEGVTPNGTKLNMGVITSEVHQYGAYVELSDVLILTAIDNNIVQATELLGSQAGRTLDTITREVLNGGTNVQYGDGTKTSRADLIGGAASGNDYLTVKAIRTAVRALKVMNAPKINGDYVGIIHPDVAFDIMSDPEWQYPHTYVDTENIYNNELGKIHGVRFVESTEAKIFHASPLIEAGNLKIKSVSGSVVTVQEAVSATEAAALAGRQVIIGSDLLNVVSATSGAAGAATITLASAPTTTTAGTEIKPGEGGADGRDVYSTLILGAKAYGVTEVTGGGLTHIVKQLGSGGTTDPLDQRATVGWKAIKTAERLVEQYMVRIETASTFEAGAN